ncbi:MAG: NifU family protein [Cytophagaceae bacterium]|jgi:Fe-S cluster biogenesis protein NfuA|nr:NifU family protein [Cytophagaceae bacterium]
MITLEHKQELVERVEAALESVRPYMIADGGNIRLLEITEEKVVKLELMGNCGSCPMSTMTMKAGVEEAILKAVPEITAVLAVNS